MRNISDTEFVRIWESAASRQAAADALGVTPVAAGMHAAKLRKAGVRLKFFPRGRKRAAMDVTALNALIDNARTNA